jgi:Cu/Ag efflux pump CusA
MLVMFAGDLITLGSLVGLITIFGIAARNSVLLIRQYQHLEDEEGVAFGPELILRGASERAAPILTTAITTALAFLPFVIFGNNPGFEILQPMAIVVLGGLVTSTLLNLFVTPALYLRFGASREADLGLVTDQPGEAIAGDAIAGD